jgi:hypothetical protein
VTNEVSGVAEAEWEYARYRRRAFRRLVGYGVICLCSLIFVVLIVVGAVHVPRPWSPPAPPKAPGNGIFVNFGMRRQPESRSIVIPVSLLDVAVTEGQAPQSVTDDILASVGADLRDSERGTQFPAQQVSVIAAPLGGQQVQLTASLAPSSPEAVASGFYEGNISLRSGSRSAIVPIKAYLAPREGWPALFAFGLLLIGATLGLSVKWITEALSALAAARWRFEALRRGLAGNKDSLPYSASTVIDEIENRISRQEVAGLDAMFAHFDAGGLSQLRVFSTTVESIQRDISLQEDIQQTLAYGELPSNIDSEFVSAIIRAEYARINQLRTIDWPWKDPDEVVENIRAFVDQVRAITLALQDYIRGPDGRNLAVLELSRKGQFVEARELYLSPRDQAGSEQEPKRPARDSRSTSLVRRVDPYNVGVSLPLFSPSPGGWLRWVVKHPRGLAATASVLVVAAVGFQIQYLRAFGFSGSLGDWLGMLMWAAVIELSGISVLDVIGRLTAGPSPSSTNQR